MQGLRARRRERIALRPYGHEEGRPCDRAQPHQAAAATGVPPCRGRYHGGRNADVVVIGRRRHPAAAYPLLVDDLRRALAGRTKPKSPGPARARCSRRPASVADQPMREDNKNLILAIVLSVVVLIGWNYFYGVPQMQQQQAGAANAANGSRRSRLRRRCQAPPRARPAGRRRRSRAPFPTRPGTPVVETREAALAAQPAARDRHPGARRLDQPAAAGASTTCR